MRILFLGNSFTYFHDLPAMLSRLTGWETAAVVRGGAYLRQFLDEKDELSAQMNAALARGPWDKVVLQEQSFHAIGDWEDYLSSAGALCARIREGGAAPVLYATWPYRAGSEKLRRTGLTYDQMARGLRDAFARAAVRCGAQAVPVGSAFERAATHVSLYAEDAYHPSPQGTYLAACVFAWTLAPALALRPWRPEEIAQEEAARLRALALESLAIKGQAPERKEGHSERSNTL